jgi:phosphomannomutase
MKVNHFISNFGIEASFDNQDQKFDKSIKMLEDVELSFLKPENFTDYFCELNYIMCWAENKEIRQRAVELMENFLSSIGDVLENSPQNSLSLPNFYGILSTLIAEAGQYRYETYQKRRTPAEKEKIEEIHENILPSMKKLREYAFERLKIYFSRVEFGELRNYFLEEIIPFLQKSIDRFMPFRVLQVGKLADKILSFRERTPNFELRNLVEKIYDLKYARFGTSGVRGLWCKDFTEKKAKIVTQAVCDFVKKERFPGRIIVVGFDSRKNANIVAEWVTQVCVANGLIVHLFERDTPTPALVYWAIEKLGQDNIVGTLNCTASHNPIEWQGIKYNMPNGCPSPTSVTDWISSRANQLQLLGIGFEDVDLEKAKTQGKLVTLDPMNDYCQWLIEGRGLDVNVIMNYFKDKKVVIDEMYGTSRDYLRDILRKFGVMYEVVHGERNPEMGNLEYANPEEPFIEECQIKVKESGAVLGLAMDNDADRYGVVDRDGTFYIPNLVLPMLTEFLITQKRYKGKVIRTVSASRIIDKIANNNDHIFKPDKNVVPGYVQHAFYESIVGEKAFMTGIPVFAVPVGIKYIAEAMQADAFYNIFPNPQFRDSIIIGGEESSGLTTKGHLPEKDGIWAGLIIMEMVASYKKSLEQIWDDITIKYGKSYFHRVDVDASDEAKEELINFYMDNYFGLSRNELNDKKIAGLNVIYMGGVRYDLLEVILEDENTKERSYLEIRASGTEPLNRIYVESPSEEKQKEIERAVLHKLEDISVEIINCIKSCWQLIDILLVTEPSERLLEQTQKVIQRFVERDRNDKFLHNVCSLLKEIRESKDPKVAIEGRNRKIVDNWLELLKDKSG